MFKINQKTNKIYITKGDNASFKVRVIEASGSERQLFDDDVITLTVCKNPNSDVALSKTAVKGVIDIVPADTKSLTTGNYVYDIQLTTFGGNIYTIVPISNFEIGEEVTQ